MAANSAWTSHAGRGTKRIHIGLDDMTTADSMTIDAILDAFATAEGNLPRTALRQAVLQWQEVGPVLLDLLNRAATPEDVSERDESILFFGIFVMAQIREERAFAPLCAICTQGERIGALLGDGVTENLACILARTYDGDAAPLRAVIEAVTADEFTRDAALRSVAWLTAAGRLDRSATATYLRDLYMNLQPQATSYVWVGWQEAIALLGLRELAPLVETVFKRRWIDRSVMSFRHFEEDLREAEQAAVATAPFASRMPNMDRHDDPVALLSTWESFRPRDGRKARPAAPSIVATGSAPAVRAYRGGGGVTAVVNPLRGVGRNDPCPCGSGKKFKKCCLGKAS